MGKSVLKWFQHRVIGILWARPNPTLYTWGLLREAPLAPSQLVA